MFFSPNSDTLKADHAKLQQSSAVALETAVTHQDLLDRTIERLRGEISSSVKETEMMQIERDEAKIEVKMFSCLLRYKLQ